MLHPHPRPETTLLPLLRAHLPRSLPALGALVWHSSLPTPPSKPFAFASFPPGAPTPAIWTVLIHQLPPSTNQLRAFTSVEAAIASGAQPSEGELADAEAQFRACLRTFCSAAAETEVWIGLSEDWIDRLGLGEGLNIYGIWLAPDEDPDEGELEPPAGWRMRRAELRDVKAIAETSDFQRPEAYIACLLPYSSVVADPTDTAQAWIVSHSDYSVGTLFTQPQYRRRGLAQLVVQDRVRRMREVGIRAHCHVAEDNLPSQALWRNLGWTRSWGSAWLRIPLDKL